MKHLILIFSTFFLSVAFGQRIVKVEKVTDHSTHIVGDKFEGVIFTKEYDPGAYVNKNNKEYTPTTGEIVLVEKLLYENLDTVNNKWTKSVHKNLKKYLRQYFGYINEKGERIIYIYAFWKKSYQNFGERWLRDLIVVEDGGDHYWQIEINLNTKKLFSFGINSVG